MSTDSAPIMARIDVSDDEWHALRRTALDQRTTVQRLLGELVRAHLTATRNGSDVSVPPAAASEPPRALVPGANVEEAARSARTAATSSDKE